MPSYLLKKRAILNGEFVDLVVYNLSFGESFSYDYTKEKKWPDGSITKENVYPGFIDNVVSSYFNDTEGEVESDIFETTFFCLENDKEFFETDTKITSIFVVNEKPLHFILPGNRHLIVVYVSNSNKLYQIYQIGSEPILIVSSGDIRSMATGLLYRKITVAHVVGKMSPPYSEKYVKQVGSKTAILAEGFFSPTITRQSSSDGSYILCGNTGVSLNFETTDNINTIKNASTNGSYPMDFFQSVSDEYRLSFYKPSPVNIDNFDQVEAAYLKLFKTEDFLERFWNYEDDFKFGLYADCGDGGNISFDKEEGYVGDLMRFAVTPESHYVINSVKAYNTKTNAEIVLQESSPNPQTGETTYSFTMPETSVHIIADFRFIGVAVPVIVKYVNEQGKLYTAPIHFTRDEQTQTGGNQS